MVRDGAGSTYRPQPCSFVTLDGGRELRSLAYAPFGAARGRALRTCGPALFTPLFISLDGGRELRSLAYAP